jgi:hypothetical protein
MRQADRAIDWMRDRTAMIVRKIRAADSAPGVLGKLLGKTCFLYGAHEEERLNGPPGRVLARSDGAICIGTIDGAVWISHLKAKDQAEAQEVNCFAQADDDYEQQSGRGNAVPIATKPNRLPLRAYECSFQLAPQSAFARPATLRSQAAYAGA